MVHFSPAWSVWDVLDLEEEPNRRRRLKTRFERKLASFSSGRIGGGMEDTHTQKCISLSQSVELRHPVFSGKKNRVEGNFSEYIDCKYDLQLKSCNLENFTCNQEAINPPLRIQLAN